MSVEASDHPLASHMTDTWGCAGGATRDFSREKNVLN